MSIEIKQLPCEFCKMNCPRMDLIIEDAALYADNIVVDRVLILKCENEEICKDIRKEFDRKNRRLKKNDQT